MRTAATPVPDRARHRLRWTALLATASLAAGTATGASAGSATEFFNEPSVRLFQLEIPAPALSQLRRSPRNYVKAKVTEGNTVLTNVGVRLKGMGSFRSVDEKPALTVKFDEFTPGQEYRGFTRLMFNNSVQDPTFLAEFLANGLFRDAGLPAAQVTYARVQLDGRDLGLYVVMEAMNKRFLKQHFKSAKGNLYEGYLVDIDGRLDQDNGESSDQQDVRALLEACRISDPRERFRQLNRVLDVDRFVSFVAMEMLIGHWDGYAIHTNNYRIYHEPASGKMVFITHGLDWAFRRPNISIQPPMKSIVGRAVLQTSEGQQLYRERIGTLFANVFRLPVITNRMNQALGRIRSAGLSADALAQIEKRANGMKERIELRARRVAEQLAGTAPATVRFDAEGTARLRDWREEPDRGEPVLDEVGVDGRETLHIKAGPGRTRASWRTQAYLARGRYRFEGLVRMDNVKNGSAALRISGALRSIRAGGTAEWRSLAHEFEVEDASADVEFVCELYATEGEVWFDLDSLKVRRL